MLLLALLPLAAHWGRAGWAAARAPQATAKEAAGGWALLSLAIAAVGALAALVLRVL
jgi:apolipoprotein N-acyltransferase